MNTRLLWFKPLRVAFFASLCVLPATVAGRVASAAPQSLNDERPALPPQVGETAPDFELNELKGTSVTLSKLAASGPVVLVQLRGYPGYQCPFCTAQVGHFLENADKFTAAKASVVFVYPGPADGLKDHANEFVRGKDFPANFYLLLDPDYQAVGQYGLRWDAPHETAYPATFVLDQNREVLFAKVSHSHDDRAKVDDVLAALPQ
jgi:peroxiredoxin Q/BCP